MSFLFEVALEEEEGELVNLYVMLQLPMGQVHSVSCFHLEV